MIALGMQESVRIKPAQGTRIACLSGVIWFTREGDPRDFFLMHGDCIEPGPEVIMFTALEPAILRVSKRRRPSWSRRLAAAVHAAIRLLKRPPKRFALESQ
jgi:hypothetical protein